MKTISNYPSLCRRLAAWLISTTALVSISLTCAAQTRGNDDVDSQVRALMMRVGPPSQIAIETARQAGMENVQPHTLTGSEWEKVSVALAALPAWNREILLKRLHYISFLDGVPGEGTALTSPATEKGLYDITFRASVLSESFSAFLTTKERSVFKADHSGFKVTVLSPGTDVMTYLLLHESTHVADFACKTTSQPHNSFDEGIWLDDQTMVPDLQSSPATATHFHRGNVLGVRQAAKIYDSLAQSPFVSLYGTASRHEDLAELVAWREIQLHGGNLVVELTNTQEKVIRRWKPLAFVGVGKRFDLVDVLLNSGTSCAGPLK